MGNVNWGEVIQEAQSNGGSFGLIPDGDYDLLVTKVETSKTQNDKTMYVVEATIQGGPSANRKVWENLIVSPENGKAMGWFFRKTGALGYPVEWFEANAPTDEQVVQAFTGRPFRGKINTRPGNGQFKDKNQIAEWYAPQGAPTQQAPAPQGYQPPQQQQQAPQAAPVPAPAAYGPPQPAAAPQGYPAPAPAPAQQAPAAPLPPVAAPAPVPAPQPYQAPAAAPQGFPAPAAAPAPAASPWEAAGGAPAPNAPF